MLTWYKAAFTPASEVAVEQPPELPVDEWRKTLMKARPVKPVFTPGRAHAPFRWRTRS